MRSPHIFQDFGTQQSNASGKKLISADEIEDLKLQAFDSGFQAGWEDAVKAQLETRTHLSAELAASLQTASFEYHEVRATLNASAQSIMEEIVEKILPLAAQASLGAQIRDVVLSTLRTSTDRRIEIAVSQVDEAAVRQVLSSQLQEPFQLVADSTMSPSQAILRLGPQEAEINLDKTVADIASAVTTFFETQNLEVIDGKSA